MNEKNQTIDNVPEFLAHALELEEESVDQYETLADSMEIHHNEEVSELFRRLAGYSEIHAGEVRQRTHGIDLPDIPPWDFKWDAPGGSPEADSGNDKINYLMNARQALELALHNEIRGRDFYAQVAASSTNPDVQNLAKEMAEEEQDHVELLKEWIEREDYTSTPPQEDLDPPNMPE